MIIHGTRHNDDLTGTADNDTFDLQKGGNDTAFGGAGDDAFNMGATLNAADRIDGGTGTDKVLLHGDYSAGLVFDDLTIQNIEILRLGKGFDYNLTLADGNVAAGGKLTINAAPLGSDNHLVFDGSAELDGRFVIYAGAGDDTITGGAKADKINLTLGGNDTVHGGGGNDTIVISGTVRSFDMIDGGAGNDTLWIENGTVGTLHLDQDKLFSIETLRVGGGHDYDLDIGNGVAAGATMTVDASALGASNTLLFRGGGETDGHFDIIGGAGDDTLVGGAQSDTLDLTHGGVDLAAGLDGDDTIDTGGALTAADAIDGGAGNDTLVLDGDYSSGVTFGAATMTSVETLILLGNHNYNTLQLNDANVAAGAILTVDASAATGVQVRVDGSAETDGSFHFIAGTGDVGFQGGNGNDVFDMTRVAAATGNFASGNGGDDLVEYGANFDSGFDSSFSAIDGGTGRNTLSLNGDYTALDLDGDSNVDEFQTVVFGGGHSYTGVVVKHDITAIPGGVSGEVLTLDGSASSLLEIDLTQATSPAFAITGGSGDDVFKFAGNFSAADTIDGGAGHDTVKLDGDYGAGLTFNATTMTNVESLVLADGHDYNLTTDDATVASGATLTVDASALGSNTLIFNGTAELDGHFTLIGGASDDKLDGGSQSDSFDLSHGGDDQVFGGGGGDTFYFGGAYNSFDQVDGGDGDDTVVLAGDYSGGTHQFSVSEVEMLKLGAGFSYDLQMINGTGGSSFTVDASALGAGDHLDMTVHEVDGVAFTFKSGAGADQLTGSETGHSTFSYLGIALSGDTRDTIDNFLFGSGDRIQFHTVGAIDAEVTTGTMDNADFDADLAAAIGSSQLHAGDAVLFRADGGDQSGHLYLIVDGNGIAGYQAGADLVIELTDANNIAAISTANFIG